LIDILYQSHFYIFDPVELHKITQSSVATYGNDTEAIFDNILVELNKNPKYASYLNSNSYKDRSEWFMNNAGGEWVQLDTDFTPEQR
jgi:C-8 sterol isomerase